MTTRIAVVNAGHYPVVVNVVECDKPGDAGKAVERHDLNPGETTPGITIYGHHRYVNVFEAAVGE